MTASLFRSASSEGTRQFHARKGALSSKRAFWFLLCLALAAEAFGLSAPLAAQLSSAQPAEPVRVLTCEHANAPTDSYIGSPDLETGAFRFRCLVFADRSGVAFEITHRSPPPGGDRPAGVIGGGWGTDFDDLAYPLRGRGIAIRNGADGGVDRYAARRRGAPLLVAGHSQAQRERRAQACEYVEHEAGGGVRRVFCDRTIQHFDNQGRLTRYSTHAFRQLFELSRWEGVGVTVTGEKPVLSVMGQTPAGGAISAAFRAGPRRVIVTDQDHRFVVFQFDAKGRLTQARSSTGETYLFDYGPGGELVAATFPDGGRQTMTYDESGRISAIDARREGFARFVYRRNETEIIERSPDGSRGRTVARFR